MVLLIPPLQLCSPINISLLSKQAPYLHLGILIDVLEHIFTLFLTLSTTQMQYLAVMSDMYLDLNSTVWPWTSYINLSKPQFLYL